ncbi:hypothetical protein AB1Y20_007843 [Prymnesium parvum]|uniref:Chromo domain-containing protein n=1 Tax=Prymnesium parvum TaxID=97485 RepID=A0AB34IUW7_PRYPA
MYEPEKVVAQRLAKGVSQFLVKWVGYESKDNTWEPIENLAGCEDIIADFKEREKTRVAQLEAAAEATRQDKQAAAAAAAAAAAVEFAKERLKAAAARNGGETAERQSDEEDEQGGAVRTSPRLKEKKLGRRTNPFWACFDDAGAEEGKVYCKLMKEDGTLCKEVISIKAGPTGMRNHVMYKHPEEFIRLKPSEAGNEVDFAEIRKKKQGKVNAISSRHSEQIHKAHARWIVKKKRPFSICEDLEYHDIWLVAMHGSYTPPSHHLVRQHVLHLSEEGQAKLLAINTGLRAAGMKASIAGDIWSDRNVALLGMCEYYITSDWEIKELVLAATPFTERHTGVAIDEKTKEACVKAGLSHDVFSSVFMSISDNGSNMKNGWASFNRAPCCVHTAQLSVKVYLEHESIKPMRVKEHGIVAHFSHSTGIDGLGALQLSQKECGLPAHHPVKDVNTRWSSGHDQMEWFLSDEFG